MDDIYVPAERQTPAERETLLRLTRALAESGIDAVVRVVDAEPPHRSDEATTVEVEMPGVGRIVRVIWYDEVTDEAGYTALAGELSEEASAQPAG